jgi:hypothetical protein
MTVLDNVPVGRITAQAREVHFWRTVLTIIAGLLFGVGWLAYKSLAVTWLAAAWSACAIREGWRSAKSGQTRRVR